MGRTKINLTKEQIKAARKHCNKKYYKKTNRPCQTCNSNLNTQILQPRSNKELRSLLNSHFSSTSFTWPDQVTEYKIELTAMQALFPNGPIPPKIADDKLFQDTVINSVNLRILTILHSNILPKQIQAIKGSAIEKDYTFAPKTILSNPGDGTIGLVILQSKTGKNKDADLFFCALPMLEMKTQ
jgi:hypothetical protein